MEISWEEITNRAIEFIYNWQNADSERSEAQTFWNEFFNVFGIIRRSVATFEEQVKTLKENNQTSFKYVDLFWPGKLLVEHKSLGKDLNKAEKQALNYCKLILEEFPQEDLPLYIIISDFQRFRVIDLEEEDKDQRVKEFNIQDLAENLDVFDFIRKGIIRKSFSNIDPVSIKASELMANLYEELENTKYNEKDRQILLARLMFCFFADDTNIWEKYLFQKFLEKTTEDGSDTGLYLSQLFDLLNTKERQTNLDIDLKKFPYVNGDLFKEHIQIPVFNRSMREKLILCSKFDWISVSPVIFGSLFQAVLDRETRRDWGMFYTSENNVRKVINPLFLDEIQADYKKNMTDEQKLNNLLSKIRTMKILDPACGSGNFLIISYRELRKIELSIMIQIDRLRGKRQKRLDISELPILNVDSMYGIEINEFPTRIAQVSLWIVDHQMNLELQKAYGQYYKRIPLETHPNIICANALRTDWSKLVSNKVITYILGNPPFAGKSLQTKEQKIDLEIACGKIPNFKSFDYVSGWYIKCVKFIKDTFIKTGFVSTNSITQGEQAYFLWKYLLDENVSIHFAHRSFRWSSSLKKKAIVTVVIIGFATFPTKALKRLFEYLTPFSLPIENKVSNISPYLIDSPNILIKGRKKPLNLVNPMFFGSKPVDGGNYLFTEEEKEKFIKDEPESEYLFRKFIGAQELLNNKNKWCLWLKDIDPNSLINLKEVMKRVAKVKEFRKLSKKKSTKELSNVPFLFAEIRNPDANYIVIPLHTSEKRTYIPMDMRFSPKDIIGNTCCFIPNTDYYEFGVLQSKMHMVWIKTISGRIKEDPRYSNTLVYNTYPWPDSPSIKNKRVVKECAMDILNIRKKYKNSTLKDLYNPLVMPKNLYNKHKQLDKAVDRCYRAQKFTSDSNRLEYLFKLYERYSITDNE
ncbi:MAG: hypothetical protein HeimC3_35880 [Candidatus Heimdallarchaeota archaeon LC_3]|nr:MAG: hypothetical protein HeimC3_35880 [Candidatus Heimdallarchaeota archaeon LC_3]